MALKWDDILSTLTSEGNKQANRQTGWKQGENRAEWA